MELFEAMGSNARLLQSTLKASLLGLTLLSTAAWVIPQACSCLRSLSSFLPYAASPRCLFVVSNLIVVFLVGESRLSRARRRSTDGRDIRGEEEEVHRAVQESKEEQGDEREQCEERGVGVSSLLEETLLHSGALMTENYGVSNGSAIVESAMAVPLDTPQYLPEGGLLLRVGGSCSSDCKELEVQEEQGMEEEERECELEEEEEEEEERGVLGAEELNRRVEDFIARFNMERRMEARMLVCCC